MRTSTALWRSGLRWAPMRRGCRCECACTLLVCASVAAAAAVQVVLLSAVQKLADAVYHLEEALTVRLKQWPRMIVQLTHKQVRWLALSWLGCRLASRVVVSMDNAVAAADVAVVAA